MKNLISLAKAHIPQTVTLIASLLVAVALGVYAFIPKAPALGPVSAVSTKDIQEVVSTKGTVKAAEEVSLGFGASGRIVTVAGDVGTRVAKGQVIASLDNSALAAELMRARSALEGEQLKLQSLTSTNDPNSSTAVAISNARQSLSAALSDSRSKVQSAIGTGVDPLYNDPHATPTFGVEIRSGNTTYLITAPANERSSLNTKRMQVETGLASWDSQDAEADIAFLTFLQSYLAELANVVNANVGTDTASAGIYATYKSNLAASQATVDAALLSVRQATQALAAVSTGASVYQVGLQNVSVTGSLAAVNATEAQIENGVIRAPISGVLTEVDAKVGEIASPGTPEIRLISDNSYEVETYVSEADISKIKQGMTATVTLDAASDAAPLAATVTNVDPGEMVVGGVNVYKVVLSLDQQGKDNQVKSGMAATVRFAIGTHAAVLAVPENAIIQRNGKFIVEVNEGGKPVEREVVVGLHGDQGFVEITSGLSLGEQIYSFSK